MIAVFVLFLWGGRPERIRRTAEARQKLPEFIRPRSLEKDIAFQGGMVKFVALPVAALLVLVAMLKLGSALLR